MSRTYISVALGRLVAERANGQCEYCRSLSAYTSASFAIDHIVPESAGGATDVANLAQSCSGCNNFKGAFVNGRDPVTGNETPLFHPRRQRWTDHFAWNSDASLIIGITATGRTTVERLHLNRSGLINLRKALRVFGVHPPDDPQDVTEA